MTESNIINLDKEIDPWAKNLAPDQAAPESAELVCVYEVFVEIDDFDEVLFFNRTKTHDELWSVFPFMDYRHSEPRPTWAELKQNAISKGCVVRARRAGDKIKAVQRLFKTFIRSRAGYGWPNRFSESGLINEPMFNQMVKEIESGFERNAIVTRQGRAPIVDLAEALALYPQPKPQSPGYWRAQCPGGKHFLELSNSHNAFYCGYCRRTGNENELKSWRDGKLQNNRANKHEGVEK